MSFFEQIAQLQKSLTEDRPLHQAPEASSEGVVALLFEEAADAQDLYDFITGKETGVALLQPGEVMLVIAEEWGQYSINFAETVVRLKTDIVRAIIEAYQEWFDEGEVEEAMDLLQSLVLDEEAEVEDGSQALADRELRALAGSVGVEALTEANPYHDAAGRFAAKDKLAAQKVGSFSMGKRKNRVSGKTKGKLKLVATKLPCGRDARKQGKDVKCSTGKKGLGHEWVKSATKRLFKKNRSRLKGEAVAWTKHDKMMRADRPGIRTGRTGLGDGADLRRTGPHDPPLLVAGAHRAILAARAVLLPDPGGRGGPPAPRARGRSDVWGHEPDRAARRGVEVRRAPGRGTGDHF